MGSQSIAMLMLFKLIKLLRLVLLKLFPVDLWDERLDVRFPRFGVGSRDPVPDSDCVTVYDKEMLHFLCI